MIGVTVDTNVYISALEFGGLPLRVLTAARQELIRLDISNPLLDEIDRVLRDKFAWSEDMRRRLALRLSASPRLCARPKPSMPFPRTRTITGCSSVRSPQARATLSRAIAPLLRLGEYKGIKILRVADFIRLINP